DLLVITAATEETDGSGVLGLGEEWKGGDVAKTVGGGQKVRWLKKELLRHKDDQNKVVLFVDSCCTSFHRVGHKVLFSAEGFCWPDQKLASKYPTVHSGKRYLNSGGFMGFAPEMAALVQQWKYKDNDDDQLFYTRIYLDKAQRTKYNMTLDHRSRIFQNLNGAVDEVVLKFERAKVRARNVAYDTLPVIIHGNGPTKLQLNYLGNYVPASWTYEGGCGGCDDDLLLLDDVSDEQLPLVYVAVFILKPTPFIEEFLDRLTSMNYPASRIRLFIHNNVVYHERHVDSFWQKHKALFPEAVLIGPEENLPEAQARTMAVPEGFYSRSEDYSRSIVQAKRTGVWNRRPAQGRITEPGPALRPRLDPDMVFCRRRPGPGRFMFVHPFIPFTLTPLVSHIYTVYTDPPPPGESFIRFTLTPGEKMCDDLVETMEESTAVVPRRRTQASAGGYENKEWLKFLKRLYLTPVTEELYPGYYPKAQAVMNFVVRYRPDEQPSLRPHHDSSTFTVNIALNSKNIDYEGGGCRFLRYSCSVEAPRKGWSFMHPGRLTHYHEGLPTTSGTVTSWFPSSTPEPFPWRRFRMSQCFCFYRFFMK
uniref:Procollagen-lysine, 2-oxoglutarate 5-dioxygenase 3 n=1 Tax=Neogobius melanostomus TaxID=47308 RepID=A0A8C6T1Y6_9GOBI